MTTDNEAAERRELAFEIARKRLAEGTWPEVMAVFEYKNPEVVRATGEEFTRLATHFKSASYSNLARFIERLQIIEQENQMTMSFNLSLRHRLSPGTAPVDSENVANFFSTQDLLIGTRRGSRGAFYWLNELSKNMPNMHVTSIQILDKIIGEAVVLLAGPLQPTTIGAMMYAALGTGTASVH